jgi:hypothetical protein
VDAARATRIHPSTRGEGGPHDDHRDLADGAGDAAHRVGGGADAAHLARAKLYQLIQKGEVRTVKIAASRRVPVAALQEYVERLMQQDDNSA